MSNIFFNSTNLEEVDESNLNKDYPYKLEYKEIPTGRALTLRRCIQSFNFFQNDIFVNCKINKCIIYFENEWESNKFKYLFPETI